MRLGTLIIGGIIGIVLFGGFLLVTGQDVNADKTCSERLEGNWSGDQVNTDIMNQSMTIQCTNGERVENLTVGISIEAKQ